MVFVCFPLHVFGLPVRKTLPAASRAQAASGRSSTDPGRLPFVLLVAAIAVHAFTWGMGSILIQLYKTMGMADDWALRVGSLLGVIQVSARGLDYVGGGRWTGLTTGLVAAFVIPIGFATLLLGGPATWAIVVFMLFYGGGGGAMAVARATMPLVFYDQAAFARASSHIALPASIAGAASPPIFVWVLTTYGSQAVIGMALVFSVTALAILLCLTRVHRKTIAAQMAE